MGGTSAVAHRLAEAIPQSFYSYECQDNQECAQNKHAMLVPPHAVGTCALAQQANLVHVHASEDWAACLQGVAASALPTVVTLHDCRSFTGGCPYPLECPHWQTGCVAECPRQFPLADQVAQAKREAMLRCHPCLVAPSRWMANMAKTVWPTLDVRVVPNGVPWPQRLFSRVQARRAAGVAAGGRVVLFVAHGGLEAGYKQGRRFLELFTDVQHQVPQTLCFGVGGESMAQQGPVVFFPYVSGQALLQLMRAADVLVLPSLADNHPLLILEAMSAGIPTLAFACGGIPEQIRTEEDGVLIPPNDWGALGKKLVELLRSPVRLREMGKNAREGGARRFTQERMTSDYARLYRHVQASSQQ